MTASPFHLKLSQEQSRLGLLSDSHGNENRTRAALRLFAETKVDALLHAGDIGSEGVLDLLAEFSIRHGVPVVGVLGNVDLWNPRVQQYPRIEGLTVAGRLARADVAGVGLAVVHGDDPRLMDQAMNLPGLGCIITGHTHVADDRTTGGIRILNPGALHRAASPSCATLDLPSGRFRLFPITT